MSCQNWVLAAALALACAAGCDQRTPQKPEQPVPTGPDRSPAATQPHAATTEPATSSAETRPAVSVLFIDGQEFHFPPAKLHVTKDGHTVLALLYSQDPKNAINNDYKGNRYYLPMPLDINDPRQITGAEWQFRAIGNEYVENDHGIFLEGDRVQYQPQNVIVSFGGDMLFARVEIKGQFLEFVGDNRTPRSVLITGTLLAPIEYKD